MKSETDKKKMEYLGNIFTHYNYTTTDITVSKENGLSKILSHQSNFKVIIDHCVAEVQLPEQSPFTDWKEARRFAGPLPFTFTFNERDKTFLIIEGVRQNWVPKPIKIEEYHFKFLQEMQLKNAFLANAFEIDNLSYYWKKGVIEQWRK